MSQIESMREDAYMLRNAAALSVATVGLDITAKLNFESIPPNVFFGLAGAAGVIGVGSAIGSIYLGRSANALEIAQVAPLKPIDQAYQQEQ